MNWNRFIIKTHKWLAVGIGLWTLVWFVSGIVMSLPVTVFGAPQRVAAEGPAGPGYKEVAVTIAQAIAAVETGVGHAVEVDGISFRRISGRLLYHVQTASAGSHLVDAVSGARFVIDETVARELLRLVAPNVSPAEVTLVPAYDSDYRYGPLPAYRFAVGDSWKTNYYVAVATGEVRATNWGGRWRGFIAGLHTFDFLHGVMSGLGVRVTLITTSVVGTVMSLFGLAILWLQFVHWREKRKAAKGA